MLTAIQDQYDIFVHRLSPKTYSSIRLTFYVLCIFICHLSAALLYEIIYKTPYSRNNSPSPQENPQSDILSIPFATVIFNQLFGFIYGFFRYQICNKNSETNESQQVPTIQFIKISIIQIIHLVAATVFTIQTSFLLVNMINSCQLIGVVLIAVFCTQASKRFQVQKRQIVIALFLCGGIIIFNVFSDKNSNPNPQTNWLAVIILIISVTLFSYKPELSSRMRQKYNPQASYMYYQISKYLFIFSILFAIITNQLWSLLKFIWQHDRVVLDLCIQSLLNMVGSIFIYRIIIGYKQHVVPFVVTIRRLLSSIISINYFNYRINSLQYIGMGIIFGTILLEICLSMRQKQQNGQNQDIQDKIGISTKPSYDLN